MSPQVLLWGTVPTAEGVILPVVKLADFGTVRVLEAGQANSFVGTPQYMAPEILRRHVLGEQIEHSIAVDIYSLGALMYAIFALTYPVEHPPQMQTVAWARRVAEGNVNWAHPRIAALSVECVALMRRMLEVNPAVRITAGQALSHKWFDSIRSVAFQVPLLAVG